MRTRDQLTEIVTPTGRYALAITRDDYVDLARQCLLLMDVVESMGTERCAHGICKTCAALDKLDAATKGGAE